MKFSHAALGTWAVALALASGSAWSQQGESSEVIPPSGIALAGEGLASLTPTGMTLHLASYLDISIEPMLETIKVAAIPEEDLGLGDSLGDSRFEVRGQATWMGASISGWKTDSGIMLNSPFPNQLGWLGPLNVDLVDGDIWREIDGMPEMHLFKFDTDKVIVRQTLHEPAPGGTRFMDLDIVVPAASVVFSPMAYAYAGSQPWSSSYDQIGKFIRTMYVNKIPFAELRFQATYTLADDASISVVPEPASLWMMAVGLCLLGTLAARRQS